MCERFFVCFQVAFVGKKKEKKEKKKKRCDLDGKREGGERRISLSRVVERVSVSTGSFSTISEQDFCSSIPGTGNP